MNVSRAATLLGSAGLIPFWAFALAAHMRPNIDLAYKAIEAEIIWGAVILSFMAGARWAMILKSDGSTLRLSGFALMCLPALVAPFFAHKLALGLLALSFFVLLVAELSNVARAESSAWYLSLRIALSVGAVGALAFAALAI